MSFFLSRQGAAFASDRVGLNRAKSFRIKSGRGESCEIIAICTRILHNFDMYMSSEDGILCSEYSS